jgi:hypothetical protein
MVIEILERVKDIVVCMGRESNWELVLGSAHRAAPALNQRPAQHDSEDGSDNIGQRTLRFLR